MPTQQYLYVHIPGRGQLTLSLPGGFERAFRDGRLPESTVVWHSFTGTWLPMALHPEVARLQKVALEETYLDYEFLPPEPVEPPAPPLRLEPPPPEPPAPPEELDVLVESCFANPPAQDPAQLPLIAVDDWQIHLAEFSQLVARSSAREQRKEAARNSGGTRRSEAFPVIVAGVPEEVLDPHVVPAPELARFRARLLVGALVLFVAMGIGAWFWYRAPGGAAPSDDLAGQVLTPRQRDSLARASAGSNVQISAPSPLGELEAALENDLGIADAVIWRPALDFASPEQVLRASRKLEAVKNSIGLYRLGAWRLADSLSVEGDPRLEPFNETERIDAVLGIMQAAVVLLDSLNGQFRVIGETLVFDIPSDAEHYNEVARIADSLLHDPVDLDSFPRVRAPRRAITRLLATLPKAIAASPVVPEVDSSGNP